MEMRKVGFIMMLVAMHVSVRSQIASKPIDRNAIPETCQLYDYLRNEVWGKQVISGCQARWDYNTIDAEEIHQASGYYPALNIFDFQHFRHSNLNYRSDVAKRWWDDGGIVGFIWHWSVPVDTLLSDKDGYSFYSPTGTQPPRKGTSFSPRKALEEGTMEHRIICQNLDTIAGYLLHYQSQGIPIIWRPLHEAAGNTNRGGTAWFWWGNDGADVFKRLYIFMQKYLMDRGIHNLIYVWTSELDDDDWYPGDDYVDIVARDSYRKSASHDSYKDQFTLLQSKYPSKMLALAECDCMPGIENMQSDKAMWLFAAPWTANFVFGYNNDAAFWKHFLGSDKVLTRDRTFNITNKTRK